MKSIILMLVVEFFFILSCGDKKKVESTVSTTEAPKSMVKDATSYDPNRGEGSFTEKNVVIDPTLNADLASKGEKVAGVKCTSCHKMSDEKLVGPGWKGVTTRRTPHWIMNFITNPNPMIDKDPALQAQLELCLVRMPNQSLNEEEARSLVEFMRKNDGVK